MPPISKNNPTDVEKRRTDIAKAKKATKDAEELRIKLLLEAGPMESDSESDSLIKDYQTSREEDFIDDENTIKYDLSERKYTSMQILEFIWSLRVKYAVMNLSKDTAYPKNSGMTYLRSSNTIVVNSQYKNMDGAVVKLNTSSLQANLNSGCFASIESKLTIIKRLIRLMSKFYAIRMYRFEDLSLEDFKLLCTDDDEIVLTNIEPIRFDKTVVQYCAEKEYGPDKYSITRDTMWCLKMIQSILFPHINMSEYISKLLAAKNRDEVSTIIMSQIGDHDLLQEYKDIEFFNVLIFLLIQNYDPTQKVKHTIYYIGINLDILVDKQYKNILRTDYTTDLIRESILDRNKEFAQFIRDCPQKLGGERKMLGYTWEKSSYKILSNKTFITTDNIAPWCHDNIVYWIRNSPVLESYLGDLMNDGIGYESLAKKYNYTITYDTDRQTKHMKTHMKGLSADYYGHVSCKCEDYCKLNNHCACKKGDRHIDCICAKSNVAGSIDEVNIHGLSIIAKDNYHSVANLRPKLMNQCYNFNNMYHNLMSIYVTYNTDYIHCMVMSYHIIRMLVSMSTIKSDVIPINLEEIHKFYLNKHKNIFEYRKMVGHRPISDQFFRAGNIRFNCCSTSDWENKEYWKHNNGNQHASYSSYPDNTSILVCEINADRKTKKYVEYMLNNDDMIISTYLAMDDLEVLSIVL